MFRGLSFRVRDARVKHICKRISLTRLPSEGSN